jgi:alkylation response protein AidB-like acyl-CoA dehydrogenase
LSDSTTMEATAAPTIAPTIESIYGALNEHAAEFEALAREAETERRPPEALAALMRKVRIPLSKVPHAVGGCELAPAQQIDFFARIAYLNPTAGWLAFNQSGVLGLLAANLSDEGIEQLLPPGACPLVAAVSAPTGRSEKVDGGYTVSGRWSYASGVTCADYAFLMTICPDPPGPLGVLLRPDQFELHDDWNVAALQGTGSLDVSAENAFVPDALACSPLVQRRGGSQYSRIGLRGYVGGENLGFSLGVAQRMVHEIARLAPSKKRVLDPTPVGDRGAFQQELGRADATLRAARAYAMDEFERAIAIADSTEAHLSPQDTARLDASIGFATESIIQAAVRLFPYAGAGALHLSSPIQRTLRDVIGSGQHVIATNETLDAWGKALMEQAAEPQ